VGVVVPAAAAVAASTGFDDATRDDATRAVGGAGAVALTGGAGSASAFLTRRLGFPRGFVVFPAAGGSVGGAASTGGVAFGAAGVAALSRAGGGAAVAGVAAAGAVGGVAGPPRVVAAASAAIMCGSSMVADGSAARSLGTWSAGCGDVSCSSSGR
jgi:hypothetical protein